MFKDDAARISEEVIKKRQTTWKLKTRLKAVFRTKRYMEAALKGAEDTPELLKKIIKLKGKIAA
jgi:hypothetical protein